MRFPAPHRSRGALVFFALLWLAVSAASGVPPAEAARWDTYNNANSLNSVTVAQNGTVVWCASDKGLHRFDVATHIFTRFNKDPGKLASNAIVEVEEDAQGNTWFATRGGGVSVLTIAGAWQTITTFAGLPSDSVSCLEPSPLGMWVGTRKGLAFFDGFSLAAVWPDGVNPPPFGSNVILDIAHAGPRTWIGTLDGAYWTLTTVGQTWTKVIGGLPAGASVDALAGPGTSGEIWCVSGGLPYRGGETGVWTAAPDGLNGATAYTIEGAPDAGGGPAPLYLGASDGIYQWGGSAWIRLGNGGFPVRSSVSRGLWAGNVEGLWGFNGTSWNLYNSAGPRGNWVQGLALQGSTVYFTTRPGGGEPGSVARFDGTNWRSFFHHYTPSEIPDTTLESQEGVFGLLVDSQGHKWAGQWGWAVSRFDDAQEPPHFDHFWYSQLADSVKHTYLWATAEDAQHNRWFGLDTPVRGVIIPLGLDRIADDGTRTNFNPSDGVSQMSGPQVRSICFAPGQAFEMWVGYADQGVDVFTDPTLRTRARHITAAIDGLLNDDTWSIRMYGDSVWIATSSGLTRFSRTDGLRKEAIGTQPPSSRGAVQPFDIDAEGGVWWATTGGVFHRRPDRSVEVFQEDNSPLLSNDVHAVLVDRATGDVWIGSVLGLNRYSPNASSSAPTDLGAKLTVYPNPALLSSAGLSLHAAGVVGQFHGLVHDVRGRIVRHLVGNAALSGGAVWDARDDGGRTVRPGLYLITVAAGGQERSGRVFLMR